MNSSPGSVIVLFLINGDSVTQIEGQMTLIEGDSLTVNCSYETTQYPALFWYVQYPEEGPQLLLRASKVNDKRSNKGFEATYNQENTSFHLKKALVQDSDSALYYCALEDTVTGSELSYATGTAIKKKKYKISSG
uniref:Ig-like domain-containing protein n=1 Tax=Sus scrofa TaxID=9823 RepID=A0A8D1HVS8_PIG